MKKPLEISLIIGVSILGAFALWRVALFIFGLLLFGTGDSFPEPGESSISWREDLPPGATDIKESSWAEGFLPDYDYYLRARMSKQDFMQFVAEQQLTPHTPSREYSEGLALSWSGHLLEDATWWNPSEDVSATYVREANTEWTYAKYEDGYIYFRSFDH